MTKREFITKSGNVFEWEENQEVIDAVKLLHDSNALNTLKMEILKDETSNS